MALVLTPVIKGLAGLVFSLVFAPRLAPSDGATSSGDGLDRLSTEPLDELARQPAPSSAPSTTSTTSAPLDPPHMRASADGNTAFLTEAEVERLLAPASAPSAPSTPALPAPSSAPSADASELAAREELARELLREAPRESAPVEQIPVVTGEVLDSPETAARKLHTLATTTTSAQRDSYRAFIRAMQAAMGGIGVDGRIGRETAARIRELTGLRISGLS